MKGVHAIAQEIEVRPYGTHVTADDEIAKRSISTLAWRTTAPRNAVTVRVQKGWVTLEGTVEWQYQKNAAASAIRDLAGVVGISNLIAVAPRPTSSDVKRRIEEVYVLDGKVTLDGTVKRWSEQQAAEHAAWSAAGVKSVEDHLRIG